jgi:uncharacterized protein YkwD
MINIAIIGYGYWGPNLVRNFSELPNAKVAAVADLDKSRLEVVARRYPTVRTTTDIQEILGDPAIDAVARAHAVDMLQRGYFAHEAPDGRTPFDRMRLGNVQFTAAGENLALAPTVALAHQGLMDSPGHKANILHPAFRRVGIGAARADGRGRMFTQDFAN